MAIIFRIPTGRELTFAEVDENFRQLDFVLIARNAFGTHPAFATKEELFAFLLAQTTGDTTPVPAPVFTQSYTTVLSDTVSKCGTATPSAVGIQRTATSSESAAAALSQAKLLAVAAIQCVGVVTYQAVAQTYTTTSADYQTRFGTAYSGTYVGISRTSTAGSGTTQALANAQALTAAKAEAIAAMTVQGFTATTQSYTTTSTDYQTRFGVAYDGAYVGITRTSGSGSGSTQAIANAAALADAKAQAIAAMVAQGFTAQTQSYTTTSTDYQTKFGTAYSGTYAGLTKTSSNGAGTSQASANALALADARAQAIAAITQQVFAATSQTYTTTAADYQAHCGSAFSGTYVGLSRSSSAGSGTTQAAADAQALTAATAAATAAIECIAAPVDFNRWLGHTQYEGAVTLTGTGGAEQFGFDLPLSTSTDPNPAAMEIFLRSEQVGHVDYNGADTGVKCGFRTSPSSKIYVFTFTNGNVTLQ